LAVSFSYSSTICSRADKFSEAIANGTILGTDVPAVVQKLFQAVEPTSTPTSIPDAMTKAASAFGISGTPAVPPPKQSILENVLTLVLDGFTSSDIEAVALNQVCYAFEKDWYSDTDHRRIPS
jgi:hypothetical protein